MKFFKCKRQRCILIYTACQYRYDGDLCTAPATVRARQCAQARKGREDEGMKCCYCGLELNSGWVTWGDGKQEFVAHHSCKLERVVAELAALKNTRSKCSYGESDANSEKNS